MQNLTQFSNLSCPAYSLIFFMGKRKISGRVIFNLFKKYVLTAQNVTSLKMSDVLIMTIIGVKESILRVAYSFDSFCQNFKVKIKKNHKILFFFNFLCFFLKFLIF